VMVLVGVVAGHRDPARSGRPKRAVVHRVADFGSGHRDFSTTIDDSAIVPGLAPRISRHTDEPGHMPKAPPRIHGHWPVMSPLACCNPPAVT
jgi:hypothetical protein